MTPPWSADQNLDLLGATPGLPSEVLDREHRGSLLAELELKGRQRTRWHRNPGPVLLVSGLLVPGLLVSGCSRLIVGVVGNHLGRDHLCHLYRGLYSSPSFRLVLVLVLFEALPAEMAQVPARTWWRWVGNQK